MIFGHTRTPLALAITASAPTVSPFNRTDPTSYNNVTSTRIFDSAGNAMTMTTYYVRDTAADLGLGLVRLQPQTGRLEDVFREEVPA